MGAFRVLSIAFDGDILRILTKYILWGKINCVIASLRRRGGLGFRDMGTFNCALLARQSWRIMANEEFLVFKLLKAKYFPNSSIF